jgi:hypothetical protein
VNVNSYEISKMELLILNRELVFGVQLLDENTKYHSSVSSMLEMFRQVIWDENLTAVLVCRQLLLRWKTISEQIHSQYRVWYIIVARVFRSIVNSEIRPFRNHFFITFCIVLPRNLREIRSDEAMEKS